MIREAIAKLVEKMDLTREEMVSCMNEIMTGEASPAQIGSFITALRVKGETVEEITGSAIVMREKAIKIDILKKSPDEAIVDTCGTGGTPINTCNVSTAVAFVVSGAGLKVAKHGNRAVSSQCGSADVIKELGVNIDISPEKVKECIENIGIGFLFAPLFHSAMKYAIGPRREIGIRTIFNLLGPLTNPAGANCQLLGVYSDKLTEPIANVLNNLGTKRAYVVYGLDGIDEVSITAKTKISELKDKKVRTFYINPNDFKDVGIKPARIEEVRGGDIQESAQIMRDIINNKKGHYQDIVLVNAGFALVAGGLALDFKEGIKLAKASIESGRAKEKLERLIEFTNR